MFENLIFGVGLFQYSLFLLHFWRDRNLCLMALKIFYDNFDGCTLKLSPWMSFHVPGPWNMVSTINWIMAQMHPFQFIALFTFFSTLEIFFTLQNHFLLKEKKASLAYCNKLYFNVKKTKKILLQSLRSQLCPDNESSFQYGFYVQGVSLKFFKR